MAVDCGLIVGTLKAAGPVIGAVLAATAAVGVAVLAGQVVLPLTLFAVVLVAADLAESYVSSFRVEGVSDASCFSSP